jgi:hypothetical protein
MMKKNRLTAVLTGLGLGLLVLTAPGCGYSLEDQIFDTVFYALEIADIWV